MKKATLYSTPTCAQCQTAKSMLVLNGYEVDYKVIGKDLDVKEFQTIFPNERIVPQVIIEVDKMSGTDYIKLSGVGAVKQFINHGTT